MTAPGIVAAQSRPALDAYAAIVTGLAGGAPLAYWRFSDADDLLDERPGARHGTYNGAVSLTGGLPASSDDAIQFPGTVQATVPHDSGLALTAFSISLWFTAVSLPEGAVGVLVSKDASGFNLGDLTILVNDDNELLVQFQSASQAFGISAALGSGNIHHLVVTANNAGFEVWLDGSHIGTNSGFTAAWSANDRNLFFGKAVWSPDYYAGVLDEVAIWDRVLADAEIVELSLRTAAPTAGALSGVVVQEGQTGVIDVTSGSQYVGRKSSLTVTITQQGVLGTATVNANKDIEYVADLVTADQADALSYTIADLNGTSASADVSLTIQNTASAGGGTLVYRWEPQAAWIDGVPLSQRDTNDIDPAIDKFKGAGVGGGASVGGDLVRGSINVSGGAWKRYCWNRAPTGHPSLEMYAEPATGAGSVICGLGVRLWQEFTGNAGGPKHIRVVMEIKTCKPGDPTTYKGQGLGPTGGSYPVWRLTHTNPNGTNAAVKYFMGCYAGATTGPYGGGGCNWWNQISSTESLPNDRTGFRLQPGSGGKTFALYSYNWDRPNRFGGNQDEFSSGERIDDPDVEGYWHRLEQEVKMADPDTVPSDAIQTRNPSTDPRPHNANGYHRVYLTKDIDGALGTPGTRHLVTARENICTWCKQDNVSGNQNMHIMANFIAFWINYYYGGSVGSQAQGWSWLRKVEVYRYD